MSEALITGGCLCGAVRYEAKGPPAFAGYCFCGDCRKASGSGFIGFMSYPAADIAISGETRVFKSPSFRGTQSARNSCPHCSSLVFGGVRGVDGSHTIYAGSLDDPAHFRPAIGIFNRDRPDWVHVPEGLTLFETMPG